MSSLFYPYVKTRRFISLRLVNTCAQNARGTRHRRRHLIDMLLRAGWDDPPYTHTYIYNVTWDMQRAVLDRANPIPACLEGIADG